MNRILAIVAAFCSTFEGLARGGQPKALPLYLCLNHIWQQVPSTQDERVRSAAQLLAGKTNNVHSQVGQSSGWMGPSGRGNTLSLDSLTANQ